MLQRLADAWDRTWEGAVVPMPFAILRIGAGALVLLRTTDWTRDFLPLDHHAWVRGLEHAPWVEHVASPALASPLGPLVPALDHAASSLLVVTRTALAIALLLGVKPRTSALLLAIAGATLMAADRYRYLHHMHLLWVTCGLVALTPCGARFALWPERRDRVGRASDTVARWPVQLLRAQALVVYASAALAKLAPSWLDGSALRTLGDAGLFTGPLFEHGRALLGYSGLAAIVAAWELALVPLLASRRARVVGVVLALLLHVAIDAVTYVSTFGATMVLYLVLFLPWREATGAARHSGEQRPAPITR